MRRARFRIERRIERRQRARPGRATSPPARGRGGCASCRRRSARRCGDCRDARPAARYRARCRREISTSGSGLPATSTIEPSSSTQPVAVAQAHRLREVEQELDALLAGQHDAPPIAVAGVEHDAVDRRRCVPIARRFDRGDAVHVACHARAGAHPASHACIVSAEPMLPGCPASRGRSQELEQKYRCAIGSTSAGAQVSSSPSARTS